MACMRRSRSSSGRFRGLGCSQRRRAAAGEWLRAGLRVRDHGVRLLRGGHRAVLLEYGCRSGGRLLLADRRLWRRTGSGSGLAGAEIGGEARSWSAGLVAGWEGRSAWVSRSSLCCSISARVGGLGRVMPIVRFRIVAFATLTVSSLGCKFPSKTSGSMAGRSARVPCMHASRPCVRVHSTRYGSLGAPVRSAWMHNGALPLRHFLQA